MTKFDLTSPVPTEPGICKTCGLQLNGEYCSACGEKQFVPGEHTLRHFFGDVLNAITFLDGKFLRTAKLMILKPGVMSYDYINGRRVPFIKPMSMFFIVNLIYFMFTYGDALNSSLYSQMNNMYFQSKISTQMVEERLKEEKKNLKTFTVEYENQSTNMAKMWLVLVVLYFSVPLCLVNYRKKLYYFDHLTVSLEFMSIATFYMFVIMPWLLVIAYKTGILTNVDFDDIAKYPLIVITLVLLYAFERNTYKQTIFRSLTKAALLLFFFVVVLLAYRTTLFYITMWTL